MRKQIGGNHYEGYDIEPIDYMDDDPGDTAGWLRYNAQKYLIRYPRKNGIEDVEKSLDMIERLQAHLLDTETLASDRTWSIDTFQHDFLRGLDSTAYEGWLRYSALDCLRHYRARGGMSDLEQARDCVRLLVLCLGKKINLWSLEEVCSTP